MWKRIRHGKKANSEHPSLSISEPAEAAEPSERPRHYSLPGPTPPTSLDRRAVSRRESEQSAISDIHGQLFSSQFSLGHQRQRSQDRRDDPLGLHVLHAPADRSVDIIFIHGLGGTSLRTWCQNRDLENLWPQHWLPGEPDLATARILTFGYNAHFSSKKEQAALTIGDFANDLLFRMKYGENGPERLGQVPIIVVAHSMGGLVFKKAFIHGHMNDEFRDIVSNIKAVLFLATPHRGTDLAETLNRILTSSVFGHSSKDYVLELARRSPTIDELNESFRHYASKLQIFSFYETLSTNVGPMSFMILEKQSSVLGYPNETPQPLVANHHGVCKFKSVDDANYTSVTGALRSLVATAKSQDIDNNSEDDLHHIKALLEIAGPPNGDIASARAVRKPGTCEHFLASQELGDWVGSKSNHLLWVHASPGSGKSTLSSAVIEHLQEKGRHCAYFFLKHGDRQKKSLSYMLRSLAYQTCLQVPLYRRALAELARSGLQLHGADAHTIWKRLYVSILSETEAVEDLYWVIDGIDEADSSKLVVELMSGVGGFECLVRVLMFSRPLPHITQAFQRAKRKVPVVEMALSSNEDDIRLVVTEEIEYLPSDDDFKTETINEIIKRSHGNFLWACLVLKRIGGCHRQEQVKRVLDDTPDGMDELYDRMLDVVTNLEVQEDKALARILLSWAMYSMRPVTVEELSEPYYTQLSSIMNLKHTVSQICGQFVVIDASNRVTLVHQSAREYLRRSANQTFSLESETVHEELFGKCLVLLCDMNLRSKINALKVPHFLPYAATSWSFHLANCSAESDRILDALARFFNGPFSLSWIQYLAMSGRISELTTASRRLAAFARRRKKAETDRSPMLHRLSDLSLIETWAVDLMKIPAKFGSHLSEDPSLIYKCIPGLSPLSSAIHQRFSENPSNALSVTGISNEEWDDCLARVSAGVGKAICLAASALHLAVAADRPRGSITLWDTSIFDETRTFNVDEHIYSIVFNHSASMLACYGLSKTYIWKLKDGSLVSATQNPHQERALEFKFDETDALTVVTDLRRVYRLSTSAIQEESPYWVQLHPTLLEETAVPEGMFLGTPSSVALNHDCTQIAVAYRAFPLSVWTLDPPAMVARLKRKAKRGQGAANSYTGTNKVVWHPSGTQLIGIYGQIFKWNPMDDTYEEVKGETGVVPHEIQCSPNGLVFITSDMEGSIKIYDVAHMSMIYRLTSEHSINQVCFSPSSLRFYDLRGPYCNIWEPNCLARLVDAASERFNDTDSASVSFWTDTEDTRSTSISFPASESHADSKASITAVAAQRTRDQLIAYANDDGVIELYDPKDNTRHAIAQSLFGMGVESLAWSQDHSELAYSLLNGAVTVKKIPPKGTGQRRPTATNIYAEKKPLLGRGRAQQLLFNDLGKLLFIYGMKKSQILALPTGEVVAELDTREAESAQWKQHPSDPDLLIRLAIDSATIFTWKLQQKRSIPLSIPSPSSSGSLEMHALLSNHDPRSLLLRTVMVELNRPRYGTLVLPTANIYDAKSDEATTSTQPISLPDTVANAITHAVGILPDGRLVFLDKHLWVCTAPLRGVEDAVTRHFFVPQDWVTDSGLRLCQLLSDGTILCPSKGEVAIVHNDAISEW